MKKTITAAFLLTVLLAAFAYGQPDNQDEYQARDLFKSYTGAGAAGRPGARISIELLRNGKREFVALDTVFYASDKVKLHFQVNFPAYVEIYNRGSSGQFKRLFPYADASVPVKARTGYVVPHKTDEWFEFDDTAGAENLSFIFSEVQIRPARPAHKPGPRHEPGVIVNQGNKGDSPADEKQLAINELNQRALDEGRDLNRVKVKDGQYVFGDAQRLRRVVGILVSLNHR